MNLLRHNINKRIILNRLNVFINIFQLLILLFQHPAHIYQIWAHLYDILLRFKLRIPLINPICNIPSELFL